MSTKIRVNEIFTSFDGEVNYYGQGSLTTFIRLSGCNLSCSYCDTPGSQDPKAGSLLTCQEVLDKVLAIGLDKVTLTGGEPLLQQNVVFELATELLNKGINVTCETNGTIAPTFFSTVKWVVDYKMPSSGANKAFDKKWFYHLNKDDIVKFVISDESDYLEALSLNKVFTPLCKTAFSAAQPFMDYKVLLSWLLRDKVSTLINVQIHKLLGIA